MCVLCIYIFSREGYTDATNPAPLLKTIVQKFPMPYKPDLSIGCRQMESKWRKYKHPHLTDQKPKIGGLGSSNMWNPWFSCINHQLSTSLWLGENYYFKWPNPFKYQCNMKLRYYQLLLYTAILVSSSNLTTKYICHYFFLLSLMYVKYASFLFNLLTTWLVWQGWYTENQNIARSLANALVLVSTLISKQNWQLMAIPWT